MDSPRVRREFFWGGDNASGILAHWTGASLHLLELAVIRQIFFESEICAAGRLVLPSRPMKTTPPTSDVQDSADSRQRLETLFADAHGEILGTLFYLVGNMEDARDALQETFLKCWRHREQITRVTNLKAWVFRIALNTGRDCRKAAWNRRRQPILEETEMVSTADSPDAALLRDEQLSVLQAQVLRLREEEREVFLLRQNGDMTYEQIAEAMSLPIGTVKTRMRIAIRQLRESVGGQS